MRILIVLTYYRPHTSGLTIYAESLAQAMAERGHQVTVLTSQYERTLLREEVRNGVRIVRVPVAFRVSKGVLAPTFGWEATRQVLSHDVIHLHLPQFDAAGVALRGRFFKKPTVITYHCDLELPSGLFNRFVNQVVHLMNHLAALSAHRVVTYTQDYADHSAYLRRYRDKLRVIPPPVVMPKASLEAVQSFAQQHALDSRRPVVGIAARFAAEKGVEILLDALPQVLERYPNTLVLYAGQYQQVLGEEGYYQRLIPRINAYHQGGHWEFLGVLDPLQMAAFFPNLDALVVPSLNSTEAFGLVQIEAFSHGTPVVASNLPGVRQPVSMTGMGQVVPIGDSDALARALLEIFDRPDRYRKGVENYLDIFTPDAIAAAYESLYAEVMQEIAS